MGVPSFLSCGFAFDQICSLASGVEFLPGRMEVREQLLLGLVMPKLLWSAPLVPEIPNTVVSAFFKAMRGHMTWWCKGRVWADHITLHPQFAPAIRCLVTAVAHAGSMSAVLRASVAHHARVLGMRVVSSHGALRVTPSAEADAHVVDAARKAAAITGNTIDQGFDPSADEGHALRVAARVLALAKVQRSRFDSEGVEQVDWEVQSDAA